MKFGRGENSPFIPLACSIGSIGIACGTVLPFVGNDHKISVQRGVFLTTLGFVYFVSLTEFFNKCFMETTRGLKFRKRYRLMMSDVLDITNKIVSAIQAALSCIAGFIVCNSSCRRSFLHSSHFMSDAYAWFGTAYFIYDIWSMYTVHAQKLIDKIPNLVGNGNEKQGLVDNHNGDAIAVNKNGIDDTYGEGKMEILNTKEFRRKSSFIYYMITHPIMMIHHIFLGSFGLFVIVYLRGNFGDCVYSFIYLMEFSTPFVSFRSILSTMGLKDSRVYLVNGLAMLITFFFCRIVMWPYVFVWYSNLIDRPVIQSILSLPRTCKIGILILLLPQIYWFYLMLRGALKVFLPHKFKRQQQNVDAVNSKLTKNLNTTNGEKMSGNKSMTNGHLNKDDKLCNGNSTGTFVCDKETRSF